MQNTSNSNTQNVNLGIIALRSYGKIVQKKEGIEMKRLNEKCK